MLPGAPVTGKSLEGMLESLSLGAVGEPERPLVPLFFELPNKSGHPVEVPENALEVEDEGVSGGALSGEHFLIGEILRDIAKEPERHTRHVIFAGLCVVVVET